MDIFDKFGHNLRRCEEGSMSTLVGILQPIPLYTYWYSIVVRGIYHNMLVALPTGLGKTFTAATIVLNWCRWTVDGQIVFVAPTKPLVSQQVKA